MYVFDMKNALNIVIKIIVCSMRRHMFTYRTQSAISFVNNEFASAVDGQCVC